jgi:hypothetical protein
MPARSNDFQKMVAILETILGDGTAVTESKMLTDRFSGEPREVDICVEGHVAGRPVTISIECRQHKRRQGLSWIEEMHAKHERLPTDVLVLVSASGFTDSARAKAASYGHHTSTPQEVTTGFMGRIVSSADSVNMRRVMLNTNTFRLIFGDGPQRFSSAVPEDFPLFFEDGREAIAARELARDILTHVDLEKLLPAMTGHEDSFYLECAHPTAGGRPLFVRIAVDPDIDAQQFRVLQARFEGSAQVHSGDVPLTHGRYNTVNFSTGTVTLGDRRAHLVVVEGDSVS